MVFLNELDNNWDFYKMKHFILLAFFVSTFFCFGQSKEPVYLVFNQNASENCSFVIKKEPLKKINLSFIHKRHRKVNITRFIYCKNTFVFEFKKNQFETISSTDFSKLKIVTINDLFVEEEKNEFKKDINQLFPKIFVLEAIENGQYAKYEVVWEKSI